MKALPLALLAIVMPASAQDAAPPHFEVTTVRVDREQAARFTVVARLERVRTPAAPSEPRYEIRAKGVGEVCGAATDALFVNSFE